MITKGSILLTHKNRERPASSLENGSVINDTTYILFMLIYFMLQLYGERLERNHSIGKHIAKLSRNKCDHLQGHANKWIRFTCQAQQIIVIIILFLVPKILHYIFISFCFHFSSRYLSMKYFIMFCFVIRSHRMLTLRH